MDDMPPSAVGWYNRWICSFPESAHPSDWERFYMFVSILLRVSKKRRPRTWLEDNLREDCKKLSEAQIEHYCEVYEHLREFASVWKSQQARLLAQEQLKKNLAAAKERLLGQ